MKFNLSWGKWREKYSLVEIGFFFFSVLCQMNLFTLQNQGKVSICVWWHLPVFWSFLLAGSLHVQTGFTTLHSGTLPRCSIHSGNNGTFVSIAHKDQTGLFFWTGFNNLDCTSKVEPRYSFCNNDILLVIFITNCLSIKAEVCNFSASSVNRIAFFQHYFY